MDIIFCGFIITKDRSTPTLIAMLFIVAELYPLKMFKKKYIFYIQMISRQTSKHLKQ